MKIIRENTWQEYPEHSAQHIKWSFWNDIIPYLNDYICFNTRSGAIIVLSQDEKIKLKERPSSAPDILYRMGIMVPNDRNEKQEWLAEYRKGKMDTSFLDLTILPTHQCQFKCIYCFEGEKNSNVLTDKACADIQSFLKKRVDSVNKLHITWFGGEPLLGINRIRQLSAFMLDLCKEHNIHYYADMTTNGYALSPSRCDLLINECHIKRYIVTIDGTADVHNRRRPLRNEAGTFDTIWHNITMLIKTGADVCIRVTIDKSNINNIREFIDFIANSEVAAKTGLVFVRTIDYLFTPDSIKSNLYTVEEFANIEMELIKYAHQKQILRYTIPSPCPLGGCLRKGDVVIGTKGEIYKCLDTVGDAQWITGHISDVNESIDANWYQDWLSWEPSDNTTCKECKLQPLCNGGCPHNALFSSKMHGTAYQCPEWRSNYKEKIQLYVNERLKAYEYQEV